MTGLHASLKEQSRVATDDGVTFFQPGVAREDKDPPAVRPAACVENKCVQELQMTDFSGSLYDSRSTLLAAHYRNRLRSPPNRLVAFEGQHDEN